MAMTRSEMRIHVLANLGNRTADTALTSRVNNYLDWALEDAASIRNWRDMIDVDKDTLRTRTGVLLYPTPPDLKDIFDMRYVSGSDSVSLVYKPPEIFRKLFPHPEQDGNSNPVCYTREGDFIKIYPLASEDDKPMELFGSFWPDNFVNNDTVCPINRLEKALIEQATAYAFGSIKETDMRNLCHIRFYKMLRRLAKTENNPSDWTPQWASERVQEQTGDLFYVHPVANGSLAYSLVDAG